MNYNKLTVDFFKLGVLTAAAIAGFLLLASAFAVGDLNIAYMFIIFPFCILSSVGFIASFIFGILALRTEGKGGFSQKVVAIVGTESLIVIGFVFWLVKNI